MGLVERTVHTELLDRLLADCVARRGSAVALDGPGPNGKTELLHYAIAQAETAGVRVLRAVGARAERALGFGVLSQLFHGASLPSEVAREADAWLEEGAEALAAGEGAGDVPGPGLVRVLDRLCRVLLELASERPLLIAVDDIHHADAATLHCLLHLVRRIGPVPVVLVLADDTSTRPELPLFRAELQRRPYCHRLRVEPLSLEGVRELLAGQLGEERAGALAPEFHAVSGGNALLLSALVADHLECGGIRPQGYGLAFVGHLDRGDARALAVVRALAVLGGGSPGGGFEGGAVDEAELAELSGVPAVEVAAVRAAMNGAGLLEGGWFRSEVARLAVLEALSRTDRDALQLAAARMLHGHGAAVQRVAAHLVEAQSAPGVWAVEALREAAERALLADRRGVALGCLELAHRFCEDESGRTELLARLVHVEWLANPAAAGRHLGTLTAAASAGRLGQQERVSLVRRLLWHGRTEEAARLLQRLRASGRVPVAGGSSELPDFEHWVAWTHPSLALESRPQAAPVAEGALVGAGFPARTGPLLRATGLLADALTRGRAHEAAERAEWLLADLDRARGDEWSDEAALTALSVLTAAGRPADALAWCERLTAKDVHRLPATLRAFLAAARAEAALRTGELTTALAQARLALTVLPAKAWGTAVGLPLGTLIVAATRTGDHAEVARRLTQSVPEAMFETRHGLTYLYARGQYQLATNHCHAALADFLACGERMRAWGLDVPGLPAWRIGAAEAWLRLGNADQAKKLAYEQLGRPEAAGPYVRGLALRLMAASGPVKRRPQLLAEALDLFEECGDRYEQARVLADLSHAHYAVRDSRRARMLFRRARHMARLCEAGPLAAELMSAPEELGGDAGVKESADGSVLTESERRVAALAVRGYTNREIATKLYVTPSTVEQHLTRTYRKLGIKHRRELPAGLGTEAGSGRAA